MICFENIVTLGITSFIFFISFIGDKLIDGMRLGPGKAESRWDSKMFGHRFITISLGILATISFKIDAGSFAFALPYIDDGSQSVAVLMFMVYFFFALWLLCLYIRGKLSGMSSRKTMIVNGIGLFSYAISIMSLCGIKPNIGA